MKGARKFNGQVTITRNNAGEIKLYVTDNGSRGQLLELTMTPHDFGEAVTNLSGRPCRGELHPLAAEVVGKVRETVNVAIDGRAEITQLNATTKHGKGKAAREAFLASLHARLLAAAPPDDGRGPWRVWSDGTETQQNAADVWRGSLTRCVEPEALRVCLCGHVPTTADIGGNGIGDFKVTCPACGRHTSEVRAETKETAIRRWNAGETFARNQAPNDYES